LTPCDAYEHFPPLAFKYLAISARVPGATTVLAQSMRIRAMRRLPFAYGWLSKRPIPDEVLDGWVEPLQSDAGVRRDTGKVLRGMSKRHTLEAAERLPGFDRPTLIAWATEDRFFKLRDGERLAEAIPDARLVKIDDSYTFVSEDQPERLAEAINDFIGQTSPVPATAGTGR
jgi:pimeloyl-ACP methyl ester carboxylesterase